MSEPSQPFYIPLNHRRFLKSIALASAGFTIPAQAAELTAAGLAPTPSVESGLIATLSLGLYTALLAGDNNGTGVGLVEVYDLR